jgi:hypothetical protein
MLGGGGGGWVLKPILVFNFQWFITTDQPVKGLLNE